MIIDTDASFDVDDVVAICLAHALQDRGEAEIRAIVHDAGIPEGIGAVSVLNHFYGRDDILLGAYKGNFGKDPNNNGWVRGAYVDDLVNNWDSPIRDSSQVMEATEVYRKVLSEAEDNSIVISSIGFVTNIANLLQSQPDQYSALNGYDLVAQKVKTVVWQGGWYPPIHGWGHETYNWDCGRGFYNTDGCDGASEIGVNQMPPNVEMVYGDIGDETICGRELSYCTDRSNPCRAALEDQQGYGNGRSCWDPVMTLRAVRPDLSQFLSEAGEGDGRVKVNYWGANTWEEGNIPNHKWLVLNGAWDGDWNQVDNARRGLENLIDDLLCAVPKPQGGSIVNLGNDKCLAADSDDNVPNDYTNVINDNCYESNAQIWRLEGDQLKHSSSGKCLDMDANNGNEVVIYNCFGPEWQNWSYQNGKIINKSNGQCLDIRDRDVYVTECNDSPTQNWQINDD